MGKNQNPETLLVRDCSLLGRAVTSGSALTWRGPSVEYPAARGGEGPAVASGKAAVVEINDGVVNALHSMLAAEQASL